MMFICETHSLVALIRLIGYSDSRRSTILITNHYMFLQFIAHIQVVHTSKGLVTELSYFLVGYSSYMNPF
jgi:hypothetical protein